MTDTVAPPFPAPLTLLQFKTLRLREEFGWVHPAVASTANQLAAWSRRKGFPPVVVTHALRSPAQQEALYWQPIFVAARKGNKPLTEAEAKAEARARFSWHRVRCAVDLRNSHYTPQQRLEVLLQLKQDRPSPLWEILDHDVGAGEHIHLGYRDREWRKKYGGA